MRTSTAHQQQLRLVSSAGALHAVLAEAFVPTCRIECQHDRMRCAALHAVRCRQIDIAIVRSEELLKASDFAEVDEIGDATAKLQR